MHDLGSYPGGGRSDPLVNTAVAKFGKFGEMLAEHAVVPAAGEIVILYDDVDSGPCRPVEFPNRYSHRDMRGTARVGLSTVKEKIGNSPTTLQRAYRYGVLHLERSERVALLCSRKPSQEHWVCGVERGTALGGSGSEGLHSSMDGTAIDGQAVAFHPATTVANSRATMRVPRRRRFFADPQVESRGISEPGPRTRQCKRPG